MQLFDAPNSPFNSILAELSSLLAEFDIGIFAISTFNTDYVLTKEKDFDKALKLLARAGYEILK